MVIGNGDLARVTRYVRLGVGRVAPSTFRVTAFASGLGHGSDSRPAFGNTRVDLTMRREGQTLVIAAGGPGAKGLHLTSQTEGARERNGELRLPLPPVEIYTGHQLPPFGAETRQMKVLAETYEGRSLKVVLSAPGGTVQSLGVRVNGTGVHPSFENARATPIRNGTGQITIAFPAKSDGVLSTAPYVDQTVEIFW